MQEMTSEQFLLNKLQKTKFAVSQGSNYSPSVQTHISIMPHRSSPLVPIQSQRSLSRAKWFQSATGFQSISSHHVSLTFILVHLRLGFLTGVFPRRFPNGILHWPRFITYPVRATYPNFLIVFGFITVITLVSRANYEAPHQAVFSSRVLYCSPQLQIFSSE
jgi:hypothetical protein